MRDEELSVIGCILTSFNPNEAVEKIQRKLKAEMFTFAKAKGTYETVLSMYENGIAINLETLVNNMAGKLGKKENIVEFLGECTMLPDFSTDIVHYAEAIANEYKAKRISEISERKNTLADIDGDINRMIESLEELKSTKQSKSRSIGEIAKREKDGLFKPRTIQNITTGFMDIDDEVIIENGDIMVVGARPGCGKSAFALQMGLHNARKGKNVIYFNLEMSEKQIYLRALANVSKTLELKRLTKAVSFLNGEENDFEKANEMLDNIPFKISSDCSSVQDVIDEVRDNKYDLIIIDYLQLLTCDRNFGGNRNAEVSYISRTLKNVAMKYKMPIVLLSQMNRKSEMNPDSKPEVSELRDSGGIEQDASIIILLWNLQRDDKKREWKGLEVGKNRQGELIDRAMKFDGSHMRLIEISGVTVDMKLRDLKTQSSNAEKMQRDLERQNEEMGDIPIWET